MTGRQCARGLRRARLRIRGSSFRSQVLRPAATTDAWRHDLSLRPDATPGLDRGRSARPRQRGNSDRLADARGAGDTGGSAPSWSRPAGFSAGASRPSCCAGAPASTTALGSRGPVATGHLPAADGASGLWRRGAGGPARGPEASMASGGIGRPFRRYVRALDRGLLRGPRLAGGLDGLVAALRGLDPTQGGRRRWHRPSCSSGSSG